MTVNLFLNPTQQPVSIPEPCVQHIANTLQNCSKSYKTIYQITLENIQEGIVGIYTNKEGRYYRVSKEKVLSVKECFSNETQAEEDKINKLNELISEIINQPDQFQLQIKVPADFPMSMDTVRKLCEQSLNRDGQVLTDILECHPRPPIAHFYVAVSKPTNSIDTTKKDS